MRIINPDQIGMLKQFCMFQEYLNSQELDGFFTDWGSLSSKDFQKFKARSITSSIGSLPPPPPTSSSRPTPLTAAQQELTAFCKGVKQDPDAFPKLLNESQFDKWLRSMLAHMKAQ